MKFSFTWPHPLVGELEMGPIETSKNLNYYSLIINIETPNITGFLTRIQAFSFNLILVKTQNLKEDKVTFSYEIVETKNGLDIVKKCVQQKE